MGLLVDGIWQDKWFDTKKSKGRFVRQQSAFRNWVTADGSAGPTGEEGFSAEPGRYHLYVALACPWAHRTLIFRKIKGLEDMISVSTVHPDMLQEGWVFGDYPGATEDTVNGARRLYEVYTAAQVDYTGRVTVPVLWDKQKGTIVNNESSEIIRMLNTAFDHLGAKHGDYYPEPLRPAIDEINELVYHNINNGVYKAGFATTQEAYTEAYDALFAALDKVEELLSKHRYLVGNQLSEADWRLFTTLVRFDPVYVGHFKCNKRRIADYPNIWNYLLELYQMPGVAETINMDHIKRHYYYSHHTINPTRVIPVGPEIDYTQPHDRKRLK
ncbi:MAG: glutathione S-transferase family protein [Acidobacteriota bacterium]|nr:glutathione S-transferase family protein [Acidobacteriota bacterium]